MGKLPPNTYDAIRTVTEGKPKRTLVLLIRRSQVRILLGVLDLRRFEVRCDPTLKWVHSVLPQQFSGYSVLSRLSRPKERSDDAPADG